ncbi:protein yqjC [Psychromonas sp. CNPT3]|uniref:DUF1090 domain-containing protein n=1 Tax=Psychromonas sp. CNPT3 TaxID=314282 RepID=UPI00006E3904|nr:DUF1090 domain-containing protein [Psychromonas sp. CNPT3]AGH81053.1 protein yqjC [Psychromonas sp. CNPT3]
MKNKCPKLFNILMHAMLGLLFVGVSTPAFATSDCDQFKGCEKKYCAIEKQLSIATEKGNERRADGLLKALGNAKSYCTHQGLKDDVTSKIDAINIKISTYDINLKKAREYEREDKVRKYQYKIKEAKIKRQYLQNTLSNLE